MSLSMRASQRRKLLCEFEGKHKLAQFSSSQSNLSGGDFDAPKSGNEGGGQDSSLVFPPAGVYIKMIV